MTRIFLASIFLLTLFVAILSQDRFRENNSAAIEAFNKADSLYRRAEQVNLFRILTPKLEAQQDQWYRSALSQFIEFAPVLDSNHMDSLAFYSYRAAGLIYHYLDSTSLAKEYYLKAIGFRSKLKNVQDSALFKPYVFAGSISYSQNNFDSALTLLKQAEVIQSHYTTALQESQRLYNLFGVLYYETGNYRQARNYFEKAISLLGPEDAINKDLLVNYKNNIASLWVKLEEYGEAKKIYESILPYKLYTKEIFHNIGIVQLNLGQPRKAIEYFKKVNYSNSKRSIDLNYNLAVAYADLHDSAQSNYYIQKSLKGNETWNGNTRNITLGLIYKFQGMVSERMGDMEAAVSKYQEAILQFNNNFKPASVDENPHFFSGAFSYINLFNALILKAAAFKSLFLKNTDIGMLKHALDAYDAAFQLADYVEKTYDSDEARLFIGKIKRLAGDGPIDICLKLFTITHQQIYLENAYQFDQRNKASILSLNIRDNKLREIENGKDSLFDEQSRLRQLITRLSLKAAQASDSAALGIINASIRDHEIELGKLTTQIYSNPKYASKRTVENIPSISKIQQMLGKNTGLVSYHLSDSSLVIMSLTNDSFACHRVALPPYFYSSLDSFRRALGTQSAGSRFTAGKISNTLYDFLIKPVEEKLSGKERLIIIPENELNYLPFEALQDDAHKYLLQKFSITYQYSSSLIQPGANVEFNKSTLAFAPFANSKPGPGKGEMLATLPASSYEVKDIDGMVMLNEEATKQYFLDNANHFGTLHLATHAIVNDTDSRQSFISFFPDSKDLADYKLTAPEIYNLNLDSTNLIILSACQTGSGNLIKGEGVMSLSRGFAYAGCPNIITSLWKAEDETTAFICRHLHDYLDKGYSRDMALQKAKMDLLKDEKIAPQFKTPNYWANLILIGQMEPIASNSSSWKIILVVILAAGVVLLLVSRNRR